MNQTFLFYDLETSGLNPAFDQVLSFAAVRTGPKLNVLERHQFLVTLRKDIIPSIDAFLTHQLSLDRLAAEGIDEYEAALQIHRLVNEPGTLSMGYNTLGFDDVFLRFMFYRNLLDPYSHQYAAGCGRQDIFPVTVLYYVFKPDIISWPQQDNKPSLKLENIARENRFNLSGRAHDAMNDVDATIELARRLMTDKTMWKYALGFFDKRVDEQRFEQIQTWLDLDHGRFKLCILVSARLGAAAGFMAPVIYIGESAAYAGQHLFMLLNRPFSLDPEAVELEQPHVLRKRLGDQHIILPALDRFQEKLCDEHKALIASFCRYFNTYHAQFSKWIKEQIEFSYPLVPDIDPDAGLYENGFFTPAEKKQIMAFHQADKQGRQQIVQAMPPGRVRSIASRILSRYSADNADGSGAEFEQHLRRLYTFDTGDSPIVGYKGEKKLTRAQALKQIADRKEQLEGNEQLEDGKNHLAASMLAALEAYIRQLPVLD